MCCAQAPTPGQRRHQAALPKALACSPQEPGALEHTKHVHQTASPDGALDELPSPCLGVQPGVEGCVSEAARPAIPDPMAPAAKNCLEKGLSLATDHALSKPACRGHDHLGQARCAEECCKHMQAGCKHRQIAAIIKPSGPICPQNQFHSRSGMSQV